MTGSDLTSFFRELNLGFFLGMVTVKVNTYGAIGGGR
jgi:hypothetical protein